MTMKTKTLRRFTHTVCMVILLGLGIASTPNVDAAPIVNTPPLIPIDANNAFFYEIGGGTNFRVAGGIEEPKQLTLFKDFALIFSADNIFTPFESIKQTMNDIVNNEIKSKIINIAGAVTNVLGSLPGYALCRANPLACQQFENFSIRAEEKARKTTGFINKMEQQIGDARGNLEGWFKAGKAGRLITAIKEAKTAGEDLEAVADRVREYSGKQGLKWIGAQLAGGDGQPPIRPIADTVKAGFNMLLGRGVTSGSAYTGTNPLGDYWDTPEEASKWLVDVTGEFRPDINNNKIQAKIAGDLSGKDDGDAGKGGEDVKVNAAFVSQDVSTPGLGLAPKILKEQTLTKKKLRTLLGKNTFTKKDLTEVMGKSSNMVVTPQLLRIIQNSPMPEVLLNRISEDAARSNVLRYALAARRMLLAGRNEPHIASYDVAQNEITRRLNALDENIDAILYESKVSREMLADTYTKMLDRRKTVLEENSGAETQYYTPNFGTGGVKK